MDTLPFKLPVKLDTYGGQLTIRDAANEVIVPSLYFRRDHYHRLRQQAVAQILVDMVNRFLPTVLAEKEASASNGESDFRKARARK